MMKKMYLMKGMAVIACGLVVASCNKADAFNPYADQEAKEQEFKNNFESNVMGGQSIDANQTWSTAKAVQLSVTPKSTGTLKIYTENPIGNVVASLYTANVTAASKTTFTVAKPADVTTLYAAVYDSNGLISDMLAFEATASSVDVNLNEASTNRSARRAQTKPTQPAYDQTNPISKPSEPSNIPTASNANEKITTSSDASWYANGDKTIYIAPNVTLSNVSGIGDRCKIYMSAGSKLVFNNQLWINSGTVIYNDGGTIEAKAGLYFNNAGTLWNKGTVDLNNQDIYYQNDNGVIFNSGTIQNVKNFTVGQNGMLWNEGTIRTSGKLSGYNSNSKIVNAASCNIYAGSLDLNNNSQYLWNDGTITVSGAITTTNSSATYVNNGTLKGDSFDASAGAKLFNSEGGIVEITGATNITNSNAVWVNDGLYTTGTFKVTAGGNQVFNNCRLTVNGKFTMGNNDGSRFVLNGSSSVICDEFDWNGDNHFWLGGGSMLYVKKTLKSNNNNSEKGFYQYGDDYAVISAKAITTDNPHGQWRAWYEGNIYVDTDEHFAFYKINDGQKNIYTTEGVKFTTKQGTAPVPSAWATETKCRPAYGAKVPDPDPVMYYYYAFEDLGTTDDFDFNDVVVRVSAPVNGTSTVQLMAAGGTMATVVTYGTENVRNLGNEVHAQFGVEVSTMVNTDRGATKEFVNIGTIEGLSSTTDMSNLPIGITVTGNNGQLTRVTRSVENNGKAPLVIVVSGYPSGENAGKWFWTKERVNISTGYTQFGAWGANASSNNDWYQNYAEGQVHTW